MSNLPRSTVWPLSPGWKAVAFLWASPVTILACLGAGLFALLGWARPVVREGAIDLLTVGPFAHWMAERHWAAFTFGPCVWYWTEHACAHARTRRHEREHVRQYLRWGPLMLVAYPLASLWAAARGRDPYYDNAFERAARDAADG